MPFIKPLNIWGRGSSDGGAALEPQRPDLWAVRLDSLLSYVSELKLSGLQFDSALPATSQSLLEAYAGMVPSYDTACYLASSVELPELKVGSTAVIRETRSYLAPGYDEPAGTVRISFIYDAAETSYSGSRAEAMLRLWRALVRSGRGEMSGQDLSIPLGATSAGLLPRYEFDIKVELYKGSTDGEGLDYSAGYLLKTAWLVGFQPGALRYAGSGQLLEISATLAVADVAVDTAS